MFCHHFQSGQCRTCSQLDIPYPQQLHNKQLHLSTLMNDIKVEEWLPFVESPDQGFRNKAKMVALGAAHQPVLGIINEAGKAIDLTDCPLYSPKMKEILSALPSFVQQAGIPPYNIAKQKGELKFILLTESRAQNEYMLRFVMRSEQAIPRIERKLPDLLARFPSLQVVSINIQPVHMAIFEGEKEIFLTQKQEIIEVFNQIPLAIRPKSFFQTNPILAETLYHTAANWAANTNAKKIWDLFCGVGGFGLHCLKDDVQLTGIEIEAEAIRCATQSAKLIGREKQVSFTAFDATTLSQTPQDLPDLVIVNPPRRGIGMALCQLFNQSNIPHLIYSSCHAQTLVQDLTRLEQYHVTKIQGFDFFPHSKHYEVLVQLERIQ